MSNNLEDNKMSKIIEVNNVSKTFGKNENINQVLKGASMSVEQGEFVSLMGASGSGKSTLLYLIGGLDRNFEGNISVCGKDIGSLKDKELSDLRLKNMGFVFQFYNLVMNLNVVDNILLPQTINGKKKSELKGALDEILEITGLTEKRKAMPNTLSGGQQQRAILHLSLQTSLQETSTHLRQLRSWNCSQSSIRKKDLPSFRSHTPSSALNTAPGS